MRLSMGAATPMVWLETECIPGCKLSGILTSKQIPCMKLKFLQLRFSECL